MNSKVVWLALVSLAINLIEKLVVLFSQDGVSKFSDISEVTYAVSVLTAIGTGLLVIHAALTETKKTRPSKQAGFARPLLLGFLGAVCALVLLAGCIAPAPVENQSDAIAQGYAAIEVISNTTANAQTVGTIKPGDAENIKSALQQAHDLLDASRAAPAGGDERARLLAQAQTLLALIRQRLISEGVPQ